MSVTTLRGPSRKLQATQAFQSVARSVFGQDHVPNLSDRAILLPAQGSARIKDYGRFEVEVTQVGQDTHISFANHESFSQEDIAQIVEALNIPEQKLAMFGRTAEHDYEGHKILHDAATNSIVIGQHVALINIIAALQNTWRDTQVNLAPAGHS